MAFISIKEKLDFTIPAGCLAREPVHPRILIFTEGTVLGPRHWWEFFNDKGYFPVGCCVEKIHGWEEQGARIAYLTSRRKPADVASICEILLKSEFVGSHLFYRGEGEEYHHIAEQVVPDVLIEDDCRSIGGRRNWTITYVKPEIKLLIRSIVVPEFKGINHLPNELAKLTE